MHFNQGIGIRVDDHVEAEADFYLNFTGLELEKFSCLQHKLI